MCCCRRILRVQFDMHLIHSSRGSALMAVQEPARNQPVLCHEHTCLRGDHTNDQKIEGHRAFFSVIFGHSILIEASTPRSMPPPPSSRAPSERCYARQCRTLQIRGGECTWPSWRREFQGGDGREHGAALWFARREPLQDSEGTQPMAMDFESLVFSSHELSWSC